MMHLPRSLHEQEKHSKRDMISMYVQSLKGLIINEFKKIIVNKDASYPKPSSVALNGKLLVDFIYFDFAS